MKYFSIEELCRSSVAESKGIDNSPNDEIKNRLTELIDNLLDPIREEWTKFCKTKNINPSLRVSSGYRCKELNEIVGGVETSAHLNGYAADIIPSNMILFQDWIRENIDLFKYDQLIFEKPSNGIASWIHIGYKNNEGKQRKQKLTL